MGPRVGLLLLVALAGCKKQGATAGEQSFREGLLLLCEVPDHVPPPDRAWEARLEGTSNWAEKHITNPDVVKLGGVGSVDLNRRVLEDAVAKAGIERCKLLENGMALQSYAEDMKTVCDVMDHAKTQREMSIYLRQHLLHPEVVRLVGALGAASPPERAEKLREAAKQAGLDSCALADRMPQ